MPTPCFWFDLVTPAPAEAAAFYGALFGWSLSPSAWFHDGPTPIAGLQQLGDDAAAHWIGHLPVPDVALCCRRLAFVQGSVLLDPAPIEGLGTGALVADPSGAILQLFTPDPGTTVAPSPGTTGRFSAMTLYAPRPDLAGRVYRTVLGWTATRGPLHHQLTDAGGPVAWVVDAGKEAPIPPQWLHHVAVDDLDLAIERATSLGARLLLPAWEEPGARLAALVDPQGAGFGLIQPQDPAARP